VLDNTFVSVLQSDKKTYIKYHNPSIRDFIHGVLSQSKEEIVCLLEGAKFFEQCVRIWAHRSELEGVGRVLAEGNYVGEAMIRTFDAPGCSFKTIRAFGGDRRERATMSRVGRLVEVLGVSRASECRGWESWLSSQCAKIVSMWAANAGDPIECARLVSSGLVPNDVVEAAKTFLLSAAETTDDIDALGVLMQAIELTGEEKNRAQALCREVADAELEDLLGDDDPDRAQGRWDWIAASVEQFEIDYAVDSDAIDAHIARLAAERPRDEYEYERWKDERHSERPEEGEIDTMFQSLRVDDGRADE
jgi:hypothetical protein